MGKQRVSLMCVLMFISVFLVGCNDETSVDEKTTETYYLADYQDVEVGCIVDDWCVSKEKAYFVGNTGSDVTQDLQYMVCTLDLSNFSIEALPISFDTDEYVSCITISNEMIYLVKQTIVLNETKTEMNNSKYILEQYDLQGKEVAKYDVTESVLAKKDSGEMIYITDVRVDANGNIILTDGKRWLLGFDRMGNTINSIPLDGSFQAMLSDEEGNVYCILEEKTGQNCVLAKVDIQGGKLFELLTNIPKDVEYECLISDGLLYITSGNVLQSISIDESAIKEEWNWNDYGFSGGSIYGLQKMQDGTFFAYTMNYGNERMVMETVRFTQSDVPPQGKTIITYGVSGTMDLYTEKAVAAFNRQSKEYQVEIVDYSSAEYSSLGGFREAILNTEVTDIINLNGAGNFYSYAEKGLFADLNEMFEADGTIQRDDYFSNALEGYEIDGKLYTIPIFFSVETSVGQESKWGDKTTIGLEELLEMAEDDPAIEFLYCSTKEMWLINSLIYRMEKYVDFDKGECYFESEEFIQELQFANCFPKEFQLRSWEENSEESIAYYRSGKSLSQQVYNFEWTKIQHLKGVYGEDITFVGYPGNGDDKGTISSEFLLGIYEDSENKEGAWEFIKFLLSEEYQNTVFSYYVPLHKEVFEQRMQAAMVPHMEKNLDGEEYEVAVVTHIYGNSSDGIKIPVYHATQEEVDVCRNVITNATVRRWDSKINNIIYEESGAYFSGQKSAEDVASVIQKRVSIYLSEKQ